MHFDWFDYSHHKFAQYKQKGLAPILIVLILAGAITLVSGAYYVDTKRSENLQQRVDKQNPVIFPSIEPQTTDKPAPISIPTSEKILDFETIKVKKFTDYSKTVTEPLIVNNMNEWNKIVNQPEIGVDFRKESVLVAFFNAKTGGYSIKITKVSDKVDFIEVVIEQTSPGKGCLVTQALEFNSHIVKLQKITKTIKFETENIMYDCID